jgi:hypothetical protein
MQVQLSARCIVHCYINRQQKACTFSATCCKYKFGNLVSGWVCHLDSRHLHCYQRPPLDMVSLTGASTAGHQRRRHQEPQSLETLQA